MQAPRLILAMIGAGILLGTMAGIAADPTMIPGPEPTWRKLTARDVPSTTSYQFVELGPQNLSPPVDTPPIYIPAIDDLAASPDRFEQATYLENESYQPEPLAAPDTQEAAFEAPAVDMNTIDARGLTAIEDAAAARDAAQDARAALPPGSLPALDKPESEPQPAPLEAPRVPRPMVTPLSG